MLHIKHINVCHHIVQLYFRVRLLSISAGVQQLAIFKKNTFEKGVLYLKNKTFKMIEIFICDPYKNKYFYFIFPLLLFILASKRVYAHQHTHTHWPYLHVCNRVVRNWYMKVCLIHYTTTCILGLFKALMQFVAHPPGFLNVHFVKSVANPYEKCIMVLNEVWVAITSD